MARQKRHDKCGTVIRKPVFSATKAELGKECGHRRSHHEDGKCAFCVCKGFTEPERKR